MSGESARKEDVQVGDEMEDGTIYAGISPDTHQPMYAMPKDAPGNFTFNDTANYTKYLKAHGHSDFHAPSKGELNVLWENRNKGKLKGTFNETGALCFGSYWSSSPDDFGLKGWAQRFSNGSQTTQSRINKMTLRCVR